MRVSFSCALGREYNFKVGPLLTLFSNLAADPPFWLDLSKNLLFIVISASLTIQYVR